MIRPTSHLFLEWQGAQSDLFAFLDDLGATDDAYTATTRLVPKKIASPSQFANWLEPLVRDDGQWVFATSRDGDGSQLGYAMPVASNPADPLAFLFVETHSLLTLWWLTAAWRTRQLARAAFALAATDDVIAAAACVRPLVETAAAMWVDGQALAKAWDELKRGGLPMANPDANHRQIQLLRALTQVLMGGKFDDRAPDLKRTWARVERTNVLGRIEKLARVAPGDLQGDYQWLCNTVHPSLGNYLAFSAPPFIHETQTHIVQWFASRSIHVQGPGGVAEDDTVEIRGGTRGDLLPAVSKIHPRLDPANR